jgi:C-terminal processing protease CtpA/Prc
LFKRLISRQSASFSADTPGYSDLKTLTPAPNQFTGRLYLLIDSGCFSTTGHLCSLLRYHGIGTFIGEETAGSYSCTDNSKDITLSRTGLVLRPSTTVCATAVSGLTPGRGILPDYEVVPTIEDRLAGTDIQMAFAVNLVKRAAETR